MLSVIAGPKLFTACPMDVAKSSVWFTDLWNYFIVSYLAEAVRQSQQVQSLSHYEQVYSAISVSHCTVRSITQSFIAELFRV